MTFAAHALACRRGGRQLFQNLEFTIEPGAALILRGRNGSGKSSLLKMCSGFLPTAAGQLRWHNRDINDDLEAHRRRLNYVGHLDAVKSALSVVENLASWHRILAGGNNSGGDSTVDLAMAAFEIPHLANAPVRYLSAGQRKRVALARLLLRTTPLWLLDEATVSLDQEGIDCLVHVIERYRETGGIVIAATHVELPLRKAQTLSLETSGFDAANFDTAGWI